MSKTAADIMEKNVITAQKDTSIFDLVDMFVENNVNAIPIVQDDKEIIGIVTDADLLYKEVTRYLMEVDGTTVIDIDKFAGRYYVDGEDMRAEINALI